MPELETPGPILIRTDYSRPDRWEDLCGVLLQPEPDGTAADVSVVDDPCWEDATHEEIVTLAAAHPLILVADEMALDPSGLRPLLLRPRRERAAAQPLWRYPG